MGMPEATFRLVIEKLFKKNSPESKVQNNCFLKLCYDFGLVDKDDKTGCSYAKLGLLFTRVVRNMETTIAARKQARDSTKVAKRRPSEAGVLPLARQRRPSVSSTVEESKRRPSVSSTVEESKRRPSVPSALEEHTS